MSNIKSNLVFDFPDPSPRFEFSDASPSFSKKGGNTKLKSSKGFNKFKSAKVAAGKNNAETSTSSSSPDKSTATTASESSFDESAFDEFDDEVFDFGKSKTSNDGGSAQASKAKDGKNHGATNHKNSSPCRWRPSQSTAHSANNNMATSSKLSFEMAESPSTSHKPLKLPSNPHTTTNSNPHHLHHRTPSSYSNTGYISEVSEFSFDRVTVNTSETPMTGTSSNVSWNFFEETKDLLAAKSGDDKDGLGFLPYTGDADANGGARGNNGATGGQSNKKDVINIRSLLEDNTHNQNHASGNHSNTHRNRHKIKINMDNVSLSDRSNELPISGIVDSNQSIISEISDVNINEDEELNDVVKMHLRLGGSGTSKGATNDNNVNNNSKTPPPSSSPKRTGDSWDRTNNNTTPSSLNYSEDPTKSSFGSILREFQHYKSKRVRGMREQSSARREVDAAAGPVLGNKSSTAGTNHDDKGEKNVFESLMGNVCLGLGFCTYYLCGTDTTQQDGTKEMSKVERQKEMDETFLGKFIFCNCHDLGCAGMSAML